MIDHIEPVFVEFVPRELEPGKLYISHRYQTTAHLCASGCGNKVVLPIGAAEWHLTSDGTTVSLSPSVGNWEFPCRAHYFIRHNQIDWAPGMDNEAVEAGRRRDQMELDEEFKRREAARPKSWLTGFVEWVKSLFR